MSSIETNPNFFIVGAPKAGTTSLYYYLEAHPDVFVSSIKEPNYFSFLFSENQNLYYKEKGVSNWNQYLGLFYNARGKKAIGEASVSYLFYPEVARKIKDAFPSAKIIIMLRNPVDRTFSHYNMDYKLGYIDCTIEDVIHKKETSELYKLYYQQFIELGFYSGQVNRYLDLFGRQNVHVILFEDFKNNTSSEVKKLYRFLGVDENFNINTDIRYNVFSTPKNSFIRAFYRLNFLRRILNKILSEKPKELLKKIILTNSNKNHPQESTTDFLKRLYKNDIQQLEKLLEINLEKWLD